SDETSIRREENIASISHKTKQKRFRVCLRRQAKKRCHRREINSTTDPLYISHDSVSTNSDNEIHQLTELIEHQINLTKRRKFSNRKSIVIVNYKPTVFFNASTNTKDKNLSESLATRFFHTELNNHDKFKRSTTLPSMTFSDEKQSSSLISPSTIPTDDDRSSNHNSNQMASHAYDQAQAKIRRRRSRTCVTTSSENQSQQHSLSFDLPDVDDPRLFIDMIYTQIFDDSGKLRNETVHEPNEYPDSVQQYVEDYRHDAKRDSISSYYSNGSAASPILCNENTKNAYKKHSLWNKSKEYDTWSEEEEEQSAASRKEDNTPEEFQNKKNDSGRLAELTF
ncbi:unnamed protein product, partial [Didymodactylos carnosus]